ncbi:hypothetical protein AAG570_008260 [Ranatra chinensis]|uniref:Tetraspanin n=1 Tax=Ranatra chinensis TaxID=642074 RepID=A0ABD0XSR5_9HEMI
MEICQFQIIGISLISLCFWIRFDPDVQEWIDQLNVHNVYIGVYILIVASILMIISGILSCLAVFSEAILYLTISIAYHLVCFVFGLAGAAVLMDYSTYQSSIQPIIRTVMWSLINLSPQNNEATNALSLVQENMGCCGADGPNDYLTLRRALPTQCRDTVTGNAFFYGCADELTWFLEQRSSWISGVACVLCFLNIVNASLTLVLSQAIKKEQRRQ